MTSLTDTSDEADSVAADALGLDELVRRLAAEFPSWDEREILLVVREMGAAYADARIVQYVAIFVERASRQRLLETGVPAQRVPVGSE